MPAKECADELRIAAESELWATVQSPLGDILLRADNFGLTGLTINPSPRMLSACHADRRNDSHFALVRSQLRKYFSGDLERFELAIQFRGTEFQQRVWKALQRIPYGKTISYERLAENIGNSTACRAVGNANGKNPVPIIVPCHRVVAKDGGIGGFTGGLKTKRFLLKLEQGTEWQS